MTVAGMLHRARAIFAWLALNFALAAVLLCVIFAGRTAPDLPPVATARTVAHEAPEPAEYVFSVFPAHARERLPEIYGPIAAYLTARVPGTRFRLAAPRSYEEFEKGLAERAFHFAVANPYQTIVALKRGYRIFGKKGGGDETRGVILVRRDGRILDIGDLKGKRVSYPEPTAVATALMPQHFLHTHGLDVNRDIENVYVGSQQSSILNVYHGLTAAGATGPAAWQKFQEQHPDMAAALMVKWTTGTLPNDALVVRDDVPAQIAREVAAVLFSLQDSKDGRRLLKAIPLPRFEPASEQAYARVRDYVHRFSAEVRQLSE
jgi:phosphonate transport system substrate-binding protein